MALRIAPPASHPSTTNKQSASAPSAPGLPDTLRSKLSPNCEPSSSIDVALSVDSVRLPSSGHILESRLVNWRNTQHSLKMEGLRRTFGIAEPVRRGMELSIVRQGEYRAGALGGSAGVSGDILEGRDWECDWEDIFRGSDETREATDFYSEMETRLKMNQ